MASSSNAGTFKFQDDTTTATAVVLEVTAMSAQIDIATVDLTAMHASNRHRVFGGGKYQGTFTVEFLLDYSEHETTHGILTAYKDGTACQAELAWGGTAGTLSGDCVLTGVEFGATMDGASTLSITGRFISTISYS